MFRFFHTYNPRTWDAMVRDGFIDKDSGIRCMKHYKMTDDQKFNKVLAEGSTLREFLRRYRLPFYFDRLQGGEPYDEDYRYDINLIREIRDEFGELFWGFQMHEWASNYHNDWKRLQSLGLISQPADIIRSKLLSEFKMILPFVEARGVKDYAKMLPPKDVADFICHSLKLYDDRVKEVDGELLPADSYFMAPKIELAAGAKRLMPEVGAQIADMRVQMAYTRGMAKAAGVPWGVYYETWGGDPFTTCCNKQGLSEWESKTNNGYPFEEIGENGGSSRALQNRIYRYAYWSGAEFMSEEWGLCCTYADWDDFELTEYGKIKKEFIDYTRKNPDCGAVYTPIAVVLPDDMPILDLHLIYGANTYLGFPLESEKRETYSKINTVVNYLFGNIKHALGNEAHVIKNGGMPDAFDILHADQKEALKKYRYIVDLTGSEGLAKEFDNVIEIEAIESVLKSCMPCWVDGGAHWMVNKLPGGYMLTVMNNNGIKRSVAEGEVLLPGAELDICISTDLNLVPVNGEGIGLHRSGSQTKFKLDGNTYIQFYLS